MATDMEKLLKNLSDKPEAKRAMENIGDVKGLVDSQEGKAILNQLSDQNAAHVKKAADAAAAGDTAAAKQLLSKVLSTKEGATLARQVMEMVKKMK